MFNSTKKSLRFFEFVAIIYMILLARMSFSPDIKLYYNNVINHSIIFILIPWISYKTYFIIIKQFLIPGGNASNMKKTIWLVDFFIDILILFSGFAILTLACFFVFVLLIKSLNF
jgi:hypothetical protein